MNKEELLKIEQLVQQQWANNNANDNKNNNNTNYDNNNKFFVTFPYPYMNGTLHLGHAFTITKADFINRFYKSKNYNTLFPFAFHGTGTPIVSSANKLETQLGNTNINDINIDELLNDNQIKILYNMGVPKELISNFKNPNYWIDYFPKVAEHDLNKFGISADFSRKFVTTEINYYYDAFIKWQFNKLKENNILKFGKNYLVYSPLKKQPCGDHDRKIGEGVKPIKYVLVNMPTSINYNILLPVKLEQLVSPKQITTSINNNVSYIIIQFNDSKQQVICSHKIYNNLLHQQFDISVIKNICSEELKSIQIIPQINIHDMIPYYEPESQVISRFGDECVVALTDQWYINYGDENLKKIVNNHIMNNLNTFDDNVKDKFMASSNWIDEWPCSRSFGLGTKLLDTEFVIDSLSDSTIYMAYYTIAHLIEKVPKEFINDKLFDYIYQDKQFPENIIDDQIISLINNMKTEFKYWYPMDLRVSGKDLIQNHLTMCLYNHAIFFPNYMPKNYYVNGHMMLNGVKMSKSEGIFLTISEATTKYGADVTRYVLADSSPNSISDGNFMEDICETVTKKLYNELLWIKQTVGDILSTNNTNNDTTNNMFDNILDNEINKYMTDCHKYYEQMDFHHVITCFNNMTNARDKYRYKYENKLIASNPEIIKKYINCLLIMLFPICPHWSTYLLDYSKNYFNVSNIWPTITSDNIDYRWEYISDITNDVVHKINSSYEKYKKIYKKKNKNLDDMKITIKCYTKLSCLETEIINYIVDGKGEMYMKELLSSDKKKIYKTKCVQFIKLVQNNMNKFGVNYINWIKEINFYDILVEWISKLINVNIIVKPIVELLDDNNDCVFVYGTYNPHIVIN